MGHRLAVFGLFVFLCAGAAHARSESAGPVPEDFRGLIGG